MLSIVRVALIMVFLHSNKTHTKTPTQGRSKRQRRAGHEWRTVISSDGRLSQEDCKFKASLDYKLRAPPKSVHERVHGGGGVVLCLYQALEVV